MSIVLTKCAVHMGKNEGNNIKILYCASTTSHLRNFHLPYIQLLSINGCKITTLTNDGQSLPYAANSEIVKFTKKLWTPRNIKAIFEVKRLLINEGFSLVITNTTLAGAVVRAAVILMKKQRRPKVLHICHGFLFNDKDGMKKRLLLLPERICAGITTGYVVMNRESEGIAIRNKLGKQIIFTHGMGIDATRFHVAKTTGEDFKFVYIAEFSERKNQSSLIRAFAGESGKMPYARLVLAGDGIKLDECKRLVYDLGIADRVDFPGYVNDVSYLLNGCDVAVSTSRYEGLPFNIMEAMASGLPIIASDIAGHNDLLESDSLYKSVEELKNKLAMQYSRGKHRVEYPNIKRYSLEKVIYEWIEIFQELINIPLY